MASESLEEHFLSLVAQEQLSTAVDWPPDAFALVASYFEETGLYTAVSGDWPPESTPDWASFAAALGEKWRAAAANDQPAPDEIRLLWSTILSNSHLSIADLRDDISPIRETREAMFAILASADEACAGCGIPSGKSPTPFEEAVLKRLESQASEPASTLCKIVSIEKAIVLPKLHTPQTGITIRSLSHHLALCTNSEVKPKWNWANRGNLGDERHGLNVLILPWPLRIEPCHFSPSRPKSGSLRNLPDKYGFFDYHAWGGSTDFDLELIRSLVEKATNSLGGVDLIVLPELALLQKHVEPLMKLLITLPEQPMLIGGACYQENGSEDAMCRNVSVCLIPLKTKEQGETRVLQLLQGKHHRWLLDGRQVQQYGLGGCLDPQVNWWEHCAVSRRELSFVSLQGWLTLCTLICEDLVRPDPIPNIVRAVGPNLVIALLLDGPQLAKRWPARYGTVLADDPGSSVLTVSALGMVRLSRPKGCAPSSVVALWKDALEGDPVELSLPDGNQGLLLCLTREWKEEFTADGRKDHGATAYLKLSGIHPIGLDRKETHV